jgi:hypothetical protein
MTTISRNDYYPTKRILSRHYARMSEFLSLRIATRRAVMMLVFSPSPSRRRGILTASLALEGYPGTIFSRESSSIHRVDYRSFFYAIFGGYLPRIQAVFKKFKHQFSIQVRREFGWMSRIWTWPCSALVWLNAFWVQFSPELETFP